MQEVTEFVAEALQSGELNENDLDALLIAWGVNPTMANNGKRSLFTMHTGE